MKSNNFIILAVFAIGLLSACTAIPIPVDLQEDPPALEIDSGNDAPIQTESPITDDIDLANLFAPFWESWEILHDHFVSQPLDDEAMVAGAISGLLDALNDKGVVFEELPEPEDKDEIETIAIRAGTPRNAEEVFFPFWNLWVASLNTPMESGLTYESMMQSALHGMVNSLDDPHTSYIDPNQFFQLNLPLEGEYEGIGAWVDTTGDYLTIITPMEGSPAEEAGLKPKDKVIAVNGEDMTGVDGDLVIRKVIGPAGSIVTLTIRRDGLDEDFDVKITRDLIILPTLESRMENNQIGYIHLFNFGENSARDFKAALVELLDQNAKGIIIDLRNNGGGFLHTSVAIASEFFEDGIVLYEEYGDGTRDVFEVESGGVAIDIPIVVLINGGSASASEILAGMIQDRNRGPLVGSISFGKGSVQIPFVLTGDQGGLRVTVAKWLTPNERLIHNIGLTPDVIVELTEEDIEAGIDPQFDKAMELLLELIR